MYGIVKDDAVQLSEALKGAMSASVTLGLVIALLNELSLRTLKRKNVTLDGIDINKLASEYAGLSWDQLNEMIEQLLCQTAHELNSIWTKNFSGLNES